MILNLILLITGLTGFVTAALVFKNHKSNNIMNIYIILIILAISIRYFLLGIINYVTDETFKSFCSRFSNFALFIISLFYLYFKKLSDDNKTFEKKELLHLIFPISFFIIIINLKFFKMNYAGMDIILYTIFVAYSLIYTFLCYKLLQRNIWLKKDTFKVINKQNILNSKWTFFLFSAILFILIRLLASIFFEIQDERKLRGFSFQWISGIIWFIILIKILVSPEILYGYTILHKKINKNRNENLALNHIWNINPEVEINNLKHIQLKSKIEPNILTYIEEIEKISINDTIFRDTNITMVDLANKLGIPKSHIVYLFKYHSSISFSEYKKTVRIQDAIKLINKDFLKENTLEYLSKKVGFLSYNSFFTGFKEILGVSPLEYWNTNKREI
jgi:AraC-like DNA-binding protein